VGNENAWLKAKREKYNDAFCPLCGPTKAIVETHQHIFTECPALEEQRGQIKTELRDKLLEITGKEWTHWWMDTAPPWQLGWTAHTLGYQAAVPLELATEIQKQIALEERRESDITKEKGNTEQTDYKPTRKQDEIAQILTQGAMKIWKTRCKLWHDTLQSRGNI
jgi:hypothetical protein